MKVTHAFYYDCRSNDIGYSVFKDNGTKREKIRSTIIKTI